jgi:hypothetical protein
VSRSAVAAAVVVLALPTAGCSSSHGSNAPETCAATTVAGAAPTTQVVGGAATVLRVSDIPVAVHAVERARGGPQRYTEVNATTGGVNVFVATDASNEVSYFYDGCALSAPGPVTAAEGTGFDLAGVSLDVSTNLVAKVTGKLPGATIERFALVNLPPDGVVWAIKARVAKGGLVNLRYSPAGDLIAATDGGG